jgi:hypothetical protein
MKTRKRRKTVCLPVMLTNLTLASWETITRRTMLIAQNRCSQAEYRRMVHEKAQAAMETGLRLASGGGQASFASLMAPWYGRVTANAKRLRKK